MPNAYYQIFNLANSVNLNQAVYRYFMQKWTSDFRNEGCVWILVYILSQEVATIYVICATVDFSYSIFFPLCCKKRGSQLVILNRNYSYTILNSLPGITNLSHITFIVYYLIKHYKTMLDKYIGCKHFFRNHSRPITQAQFPPPC